MIRKTILLLSMIILAGALTVGYEYYYGDNGATVEIEKTFSSELKNQIEQTYPEITRITSNGQTTLIECGSLSEYNCRKMAQKIEQVVTKLCLDRNGIISVEVNAQGNIIRTVGDTSCLR